MAAMSSDPVAAAQLSSPGTRDVTQQYGRLLRTLTGRARWLGSRDPESAAQETLKRSLENSRSQPAVEYYFGEDASGGAQAPEWPLDQLLGWLHGVLHYVVREEHNRASSRREVPLERLGWEQPDENRQPDPADGAPDQLDVLIQKELETSVLNCFRLLGREHRTVLTMRVDGRKYGEIADHLGVNENTVATWVSRGIRALAQCIRKRTGATRLLRTRGVPHA